MKLWETPGKLLRTQAWDGPSIHDLNDDGLPEVLLSDAVYNGQTGALIFDGANPSNTFNGYIAVAAALNGDNQVKLVAGSSNETSTFSWTNNVWVDDAASHQGTRLGFYSGNYAVADFGTPSGAGFDLTNFDGIAEIVAVEVAAGVKIFSNTVQTGVSLFDFDGDGKVEVVYAGECFLRIYSGVNGEVLFSAYHTSGTWYESPVVADVDKDDATEIVVNNAMATGCSDARTQIKPSGVPYVDPEVMALVIEA